MKIHFYCIFFNKSYMHCILSNWMNKSHLFDVFYIVSDFHLLWIAKYETDQTCNFLQLIKLIGILHRFVFAGSIFCLFLCLKICVDFKECVATIIRRFFFPGGNGMQKIGMNGNCSAIGSCAHRHKIPFFCKNKNHHCVLKKKKVNNPLN